jgi:hypothetical protein
MVLVTHIRIYKGIICCFACLNYFIDVSDYKNSIKPNFISNILLSSSKSYRTDVFFLKNTNVRTDAGWIMESKDIIPTYQFSSTQNSIVPALPKNPIFFVITSVYNLRDVFTRKYLKLQDILASAGGFIKILLIFLTNFKEYIHSKKGLSKHISTHA